MKTESNAVEVCAFDTNRSVVWSLRLRRAAVQLSRTAARAGAVSAVLWPIVGALAFQAAYTHLALAPVLLIYLFALVKLARAETWRKAFYPGLALGLLVGVPRLTFFWTIFSAGAAVLWLVFAVWIALFAVIGRLALRALPGRWGWVALPFVWMGLEYFRSELYYLRFSWLSPGYAFAEAATAVPFGQLGTYGVGFVLAAVAALAAFQPGVLRQLLALALGSGAVLGWGAWAWRSETSVEGKKVQVAGVQLEFPTENEVVLRLGDLLRKYPDAELLVLSEYTFTGPIPERVREWCRENNRYLIVGGTQPLPANQFYNTAFVVGPNGKDVFRQVKGVPIQFFKDGLPAPEHKTWHSPWGRIGICICYDLSYTRITDRLARDGAEALIVPTMDVMDWGQAQHELHARVTPVRAAEYHVPIFRIASSGVSQMVDAHGRVLRKTVCGEGQALAGTLTLDRKASIPIDRWLAPASVLCTVALIVFSIGRAMHKRFPEASLRKRER